jgi:lipoprotein NlpI
MRENAARGSATLAAERPGWPSRAVQFFLFLWSSSFISHTMIALLCNQLAKPSRAAAWLRNKLMFVAGLLAVMGLAHADEAVDRLLQQAMQAALRGDHAQAIARLTEAIEVEPTRAIALYERGREHFRAGHIREAVADFDKYVQLQPRAENRQWERGIAYYCAGEFAKGAKQFADYQQFHDQDVENSVWRYLCVARTDSVEKARAGLLPITSDPRVPMMEIYGLYQGKLKPEDVLGAATTEPPNRELLNQRLFYAHLYIGLWHEAAGRAEEAKRHILEAEKHKIAHYMWDVAHVHAERLRPGAAK